VPCLNPTAGNTCLQNVASRDLWRRSVINQLNWIRTVNEGVTPLGDLTVTTENSFSNKTLPLHLIGASLVLITYLVPWVWLNLWVKWHNWHDLKLFQRASDVWEKFHSWLCNTKQLTNWLYGTELFLTSFCYHAACVLGLKFKLLIQLIRYKKISNERCAIGGQPNLVLCSFLQTLVAIWRTKEIVSWER